MRELVPSGRPLRSVCRFAVLTAPLVIVLTALYFGPPPVAAAGGAPATPAALRLEGHGGPVKGISRTSDGRYILTSSFDNSIGIWSAADGAHIRWLEGHDAAVNAVAQVASFGPLLEAQTVADAAAGPAIDRTVLASVGDDYSVRVWNGGGETTVLEGHKAKVMDVAPGPSDNALLATASWDGTIGLWPAFLVTSLHRAISATEREAAVARILDRPTFLEGHRAGVNAVAFSPDGRRLYSASVDGTIRSWTLHEGRGGADFLRIEASHGFGINTLEVARDGSWLAYGATDGVVRVLSTASGQEIAHFGGERRPILSMALSDDGAQLAYGDGQGYISLVATDGWTLERDFRAMARGPVWALAFRDAETLLAGGLDNFVSIWPIGSANLPAPLDVGQREFQVDPAAVSNGERQFARKCSICHSLSEDGGRRAGPSLYRLFGRRAGTVSGYGYSPALLGTGIVWSRETLDKLFDLGPDHYTPGSKMPMQRIVRGEDRADLIAYLEVVTSPAGARQGPDGTEKKQ